MSVALLARTCCEPGCIVTISVYARRCREHAAERRREMSKLWHRQHPERVLRYRDYAAGRITRAELGRMPQRVVV